MRPDLANEGFPKLFEGATEAAERADAIICPSVSAQADIARVLTIPLGKIHVIPETAAPAFRPLGAEQRAAVRTRYGIEGPYFLAVGSLEARKNPGAILDALALRPELPAVIFVGPAAGFDVAAEAGRRGVGGRVRHLGVVPDEDLAALYGEALTLVFPSLYEGFGLPVLEAFACGTPVIATNRTSVPEVAGDAALLVDPEDTNALGEAMASMAATEGLRADLRRRGEAQGAKFTASVVREHLRSLYDRLERGSA